MDTAGKAIKIHEAGFVREKNQLYRQAYGCKSESNFMLPELQLLVSLYHNVEQAAEHPPMEFPLPLLSMAQQPGYKKSLIISELLTTKSCHC